MSDQSETSDTETPAESAHYNGYFTFAGYLQLVAGLLTVLFSGLTIMLSTMADDRSWLNPFAVAKAIGPEEAGFFVKLLGAYMALQVSLGWIFGLLMLISGILCLMRRGRGFVSTSAIINLFNFPHGTTVGILVLHGTTRSSLSKAFRR